MDFICDRIADILDFWCCLCLYGFSLSSACGLSWIRCISVLSGICFYTYLVYHIFYIAHFGTYIFDCESSSIKREKPSLHPPMQIIINYSFVVFASATGGLIRYAYQMKNQTMKLYQELENSYQKLREHADTVEQLAMQEERNRISREIHDTVGHTVTALIFQLEAA
ncbi:histidine kinase [Shimazuella alba]|uniref:histidine kinase n=1 Tax=Shimazuella alba TaxID=2690964 RepID=A0A6I4VWI2_9BACL|nr:histidine kinase dimerization/phosphoacceptor domain-containing protein [Shimazuella alba]MXQ54196.1 hypothetical protein [Shimazuella alba]